MNTKDYSKKYWKGIPKQLKYLIKAEECSDDFYCLEAILKYLTDHMYDCDSCMNNTSPYEVIRWINKVMDSCFMPVEFSDKLWLRHSRVIAPILNRAADLIQKYAPADYNTCAFLACSDTSPNMAYYYQKINCYICILNMYTGDIGKVKESLQLVLEDSERNVMHICNTHLANPYLEVKGQFGGGSYYYWDDFEPIYIVPRDGLISYEIRKIYTEYLERYVQFYANMEKDYPNLTESWRALREVAEDILQDIKDMILEDD